VRQIFKSLAAQLKGRPIKVRVQVDGYKDEWLVPTLKGDVLDVVLEREQPPRTDLSGSIDPLPTRLEEIKIFVEGQDAQVVPDQFGRFKLNVAGKPGDRIRLTVFKGSKRVYDDFQVLGNPVTLSLHGIR
jgi:hypothetical protein